MFISRRQLRGILTKLQGEKREDVVHVVRAHPQDSSDQVICRAQRSCQADPRTNVHHQLHSPIDYCRPRDDIASLLLQ